MATSAVHSGTNPIQPHSSQCCLKLFIITSVALGVIMLEAGVFTILATKGIVLPGMEIMHTCAVIGEVNAYLLAISGLGLTILSSAAWRTHMLAKRR